MKTRLFSIYDSNKYAIILPAFTEEKFNEFKKRLFIGLQKYETSSKTRIVHHIYEKNIALPVIYTGNFDDIGNVKYKENKLFNIYLNSIYFADFLMNKSIDVLVIEINEIFSLIEKERNLISEYQIHNIKKLNEKVNKLLDEFIEAFDYIKLVDGVYYLFIRFLANRIFLTQPTLKIKLIETISNIFEQIFLKIYNKTTRAPIDDEIRKKFKLITTYLILNYYAELTPREIFVKIKHNFGESAVELLQKSKKLKLEKFNDIVDIMFDTEIFKIQKSLFETYIRNYFGELGYILIQKSLADAIAFFSSVNHKNILFNSFYSNDKTKHLEELVLNYKSRIVLAEPKILFKG